MTRQPKKVIQALASGILAGGLQNDWIVEVCGAVLGDYPLFSARLARRLARAFPNQRRPPQRRVELFLLDDKALRTFLFRHLIANPCDVPRFARMVPEKGAPEKWVLPEITSVGDLANHLDLEIPSLRWLADLTGMERRVGDGPLRHYCRRWIKKRDGSARLIESPKPRLKQIQRRILCGILNQIEPHEAAHGFRAGRSIATFARPHTGKAMVLRMDLRDFFLCVNASLVSAIFRTAGYPERVANLLAGLCCSVTPLDALMANPGLQRDRTWSMRKRFELPHLPQGAPTSPALANLAAFRLDLRLAALAKRADVAYTRYADDVTFSGAENFARSVERFQILVAAICLEEGFEVHHRKTRAMSRSVSQRSAGLVLNERVACPRKDFDQLRAILHNCAKHGPDLENRDHHPDFRAHLAGRIAHITSIDPGRRERLQRLWDQIQWAT